MARQRMHIIRM